MLSPQVVYILGFLFSAVLLLPFIRMWSVSLSFSTITVLIGGAIIFILFSLLASGLCNKIADRNVQFTFGGVRLRDNYDQFNIKLWKYYFCILLQLVAAVLLFTHIQSVAGGGDLSQILYTYRQFSTENLDDIPFIISAFRVCGLAIGDVFLLIFMYKVIKKEFKQGEKFVLILGIILSCVLMLLLGSRGTVVKFALAGWIEYFTLKKAIDNIVTIKFVTVTIIIGVIALVSFQFVGRLLGRMAVYNNLEYIGIYTSAPIKNLDTFLNYANINFLGGIDGTSLKTNQTLISLINYIAAKFNVESLYHNQYTFYNASNIVKGFGYQFVNGHELGNCFTCYDSYISDLGYIGVFIYTAVMAVLCQIFYYHAIRGIDKIKNGQLSIAVIIYALIFFDIFFSYFSYTFYQNVFHIGFLREMILAWLIKIFLVHIDVKL